MAIHQKHLIYTEDKVDRRDELMEIISEDIDKSIQDNIIECPNCHKYIDKSGNRRFCSTKCGKEYHRNKRKSNLRGNTDWNLIVEYTKEKYNFRCNVCGNTELLEIHHIKPLSMGGENDYYNVILLCDSCHIQAHKKIAEEYYANKY